MGICTAMKQRTEETLATPYEESFALDPHFFIYKKKALEMNN